MLYLPFSVVTGISSAAIVILIVVVLLLSYRLAKLRSQKSKTRAPQASSQYRKLAQDIEEDDDFL